MHHYRLKGLRLCARWHSRLCRSSFAGEALLQDCHQIDDLAFFALGHFDFNNILVLLSLFLNQLEKLLGLLVFKILKREMPDGMLRD